MRTSAKLLALLLLMLASLPALAQSKRALLLASKVKTGSAAASGPGVLTNCLAGFWRFGGTNAGDPVADAWGPHTLTNYNSITFTAGGVTNCALLISNLLQTFKGGAGTFAFSNVSWAGAIWWTPHVSNNLQTICSENGGSGSRGWALRQGVNSILQFTWYTNATGSITLGTTAKPATNIAHLVTWGVNGTNNQMFLGFDNANYVTNSNVAPSTNATAAVFTVGYDNSGAYLDGGIGHFLLWTNRVPSNAEFGALFNSGAGTNVTW